MSASTTAADDRSARRQSSHARDRSLADARRLRRASQGDLGARRGASASFLRVFSAVTSPRLREEEERLFPVLIDTGAATEQQLVRALLDHQRLRALTGRLEHALASPDVEAGLMRQLADTLEAHVRFEERELDPLLEEAAVAELDRIGAPSDGIAEPPVLVDLAAHGGSGTLWGVATQDLNATLLAQEPGAATPEHVNDERDVVLVVLAGSATVVVDGDALVARAGHLAIIPKGRARHLVSGPHGVRYLSVHGRRTLQIRSRPR